MATETNRDKTKICALNLEADLISYLSERFDVYDGSLGVRVDVHQANRYGVNLLPNYDLPENLHEYEVFIEDMENNPLIPYVKEEHVRTVNPGNSSLYIISNPPQTEFNPRPYGCYLLKDCLKIQRTRSAITIVFQTKKIEAEYSIKEQSSTYSQGKEAHNNYEYITDFCEDGVSGTEVRLIEDSELSRSLFEPFLNDISYSQVFRTPMDWDEERKERVTHRCFYPLLQNRSGNVVSYAWISKKNIIVVLPQTKRKIELLDRVFQEILFPHFSDYFPEVEESAWIKNVNYLLPNHKKMLEEQEAITAKYEVEMAAIQKQIDENKEKYGFLHTILTSTGDELVQAMIKYLKWLGFSNVIDQDTTQEDSALLEEDIQVDLGKEGLLVIEVKGIGGTSTDGQCSQIHKIVYRRAKERGSFDVHGLYVANNEMHKEPLKRTFPPFTIEQIKDAENDERGLAYTWQFFNLFFAIEDGIITKEEARNALLKKGVISFNPSVIEIGVPYKYFQEHTVACLEVGEVSIKEGDFFFYKETDRWNKVRILSIQEDKNKVKSAIAGRFGFGLEHRVPNNVPLYIKQA